MRTNVRARCWPPFHLVLSSPTFISKIFWMFSSCTPTSSFRFGSVSSPCAVIAAIWALESLFGFFFNFPCFAGALARRFFRMINNCAALNAYQQTSWMLGIPFPLVLVFFSYLFRNATTNMVNSIHLFAAVLSTDSQTRRAPPFFV